MKSLFLVPYIIQFKIQESRYHTDMLKIYIKRWNNIQTNQQRCLNNIKHDKKGFKEAD